MAIADVNNGENEKEIPATFLSNIIELIVLDSYELEDNDVDENNDTPVEDEHNDTHVEDEHSDTHVEELQRTQKTDVQLSRSKSTKFKPDHTDNMDKAHLQSECALQQPHGRGLKCRIKNQLLQIFIALMCYIAKCDGRKLPRPDDVNKLDSNHIGLLWSRLLGKKLDLPVTESGDMVNNDGQGIHVVEIGGSCYHLYLKLHSLPLWTEDFHALYIPQEISSFFPFTSLNMTPPLDQFKNLYMLEQVMEEIPYSLKSDVFPEILVRRFKHQEESLSLDYFRKIWPGLMLVLNLRQTMIVQKSVGIMGKWFDELFPNPFHCIEAYYLTCEDLIETTKREREAEDHLYIGHVFQGCTFPSMTKNLQNLEHEEIVIRHADLHHIQTVQILLDSQEDSSNTVPFTMTRIFRFPIVHKLKQFTVCILGKKGCFNFYKKNHRVEGFKEISSNQTFDALIDAFDDKDFIQHNMCANHMIFNNYGCIILGSRGIESDLDSSLLKSFSQWSVRPLNTKDVLKIEVTDFQTDIKKNDTHASVGENIRHLNDGEILSHSIVHHIGLEDIKSSKEISSKTCPEWNLLDAITSVIFGGHERGHCKKRHAWQNALISLILILQGNMYTMLGQEGEKLTSKQLREAGVNILDFFASAAAEIPQEMQKVHKCAGNAKETSRPLAIKSTHHRNQRCIFYEEQYKYYDLTEAELSQFIKMYGIVSKIHNITKHDEEKVFQKRTEEMNTIFKAEIERSAEKNLQLQILIVMIISITVITNLTVTITLIVIQKKTNLPDMIKKNVCDLKETKENHSPKELCTSQSRHKVTEEISSRIEFESDNDKLLEDVGVPFLEFEDEAETSVKDVVENADVEAVQHMPILFEPHDYKKIQPYRNSDVSLTPRATLENTTVEIEVQTSIVYPHEQEFEEIEMSSDTKMDDISNHFDDRNIENTVRSFCQRPKSDLFPSQSTNCSKNENDFTHGRIFFTPDFLSCPYSSFDSCQGNKELESSFSIPPKQTDRNMLHVSHTEAVTENNTTNEKQSEIVCINTILDLPEKKSLNLKYENHSKGTKKEPEKILSKQTSCLVSFTVFLVLVLMKTLLMKKEIMKAAWHSKKKEEQRQRRSIQRHLRRIINWQVSPDRVGINMRPLIPQGQFAFEIQAHHVAHEEISQASPGNDHPRNALLSNQLHNHIIPNSFPQNGEQMHPNTNGLENSDMPSRIFRSNVETGSVRVPVESQHSRSMNELLYRQSSSNQNSNGDLSDISEMSSESHSSRQEVQTNRPLENSMTASYNLSSNSIINQDGGFSSNSGGSSGSHQSQQSTETPPTSQSTNFESLSTFFSSFSAASSPPEHEGLNYEWIRLKTFGTFPIYSHYSTVLAKSGWYHLGESDKTCCFSCSSVHESWNRTDDPNKFHSPDCRFLNGHSGNIPIVRDLPAVMPPVRQTQPPPIQRESEAVATLLGPQNSSVNNEPMVTQTSSSSENILPASPPQPLNPQDVPTPTLSVFPQLTGVQNHSSRTANANQLSASDIAQGIQQIQLQNRTAADNTQQAQDTTVGNFSSSQPSATSNAAQRHAYAASHQTNDLENSESSSDATSREAQMEALRRDPMGINFDRPKYPSYAILAKRVSSYTNWPSNLTQTPRDMALAGFFYAGYGDYCRCFFCGGGLRNWEPGDDPWVEHARWFSKCAFVCQNRGQSFIDLVLRRAAEVEEERRHNGITSTTSAANSNTNDGARSQAESKEEKLMKSAAVQSIKEMGYTEAQIKAAIAAIKRRLPTGKHKVSAQEILEVIFELIDSGEIQSVSDENVANQDHTPGQNETVNQSTVNSNSVSSQQTQRVQENQQPSEVQRQEAHSSEVRNNSEISDSMPSFTLDELTSLRQENTSLREQIVCKICMDKNVSIAFLPCGHLACCEDCAPAMRKCPICRQFVKGTVKTYLV